MSNSETPDPTAHLARISTAVETCRTSLNKLQSTCCMAERSARMVKLDIEVQRLADVTTAQGAANPAGIETGIARVDSVGAALGALYATCCTPTRERLYVAMFKALGEVHTGLWRLKGVAH